MSLQIYRDQNKGYKTVNLDGVLFLINDHNDELGHHYDEKVYTLPMDLNKILLKREKNLAKMGVQYLFVIIPDKSVVMSSYLTKYFSNKCRRHFVESLYEVPFIIDPLDHVMELCHKHNYQPSFPNDTHINMLAFYGVYLGVMEKLSIEPNKYDISSISSLYTDIRSRDLTYPENNGNREIINNKNWLIPIIETPINPDLVNYHIDKDTNEIKNLGIDESLSDKYRHQYIHVYVNNNCNNNDKIFVYHDCHWAMPDNGQFARKQWLASHFKMTYFMWSPYDGESFKKYGVTKIIDTVTERLLNDYRLCEPLFNEEYYAQKYNDCGSNPLSHYTSTGLQEGRYPNLSFEIECLQEIKYRYLDEGFDEKFYIENNKDIQDAVSKGLLTDGKTHYLLQGKKEGRYSNNKLASLGIKTDSTNMAKFDDKFYLSSYPIVLKFLYQFPSVTPLSFYQLYGRKMGHSCYADDPQRNFNSEYWNIDGFTNQVIINFDPNYYLSSYGKQILYPFYHYLNYGSTHSYSPNSWFDEKLYTSYHTYVQSQINTNKVTSGFEHYLKNKEKPLCKYNLQIK